MKDFDTAWKEVTENWEATIASIKQVARQRALENDDWANFVAAGAQFYIQDTILNPKSNPVVELCTRLQLMFEVGLLVGQRMYQPDLEEIYKQ